MSNLTLNSLTAYTIDGETEKVQFDTDVVVSVDERYTTLEYIEPPADEQSDAVLTRLTAHHDGTVTFVRTAASSGRQIMGMTFKQGETSEFPYSTDEGTFRLTCTSEKVMHNVSENGGMVILKYLLDFGDGAPVQYRMMITVDKKGTEKTDAPKCTGSCEGCTLCG